MVEGERGKGGGGATAKEQHDSTMGRLDLTVPIAYYLYFNISNTIQAK